MVNHGLPPPDAERFSVLTEWPACLSFRLYTNELQHTEPRQLADYQEPDFPGYQLQPLPELNVLTADAEAGIAVVDVTARWYLRTALAPLLIRGWFLTATYADGFIELLAEHTEPSGAIIQHKGDRIVAVARLSYLRLTAV